VSGRQLRCECGRDWALAPPTANAPERADSERQTKRSAKNCRNGGSCPFRSYGGQAVESDPPWESRRSGEADVASASQCLTGPIKCFNAPFEH
jgi:hypothetical protein